jgi:hypothetical protein
MDNHIPVSSVWQAGAFCAYLKNLNLTLNGILDNDNHYLSIKAGGEDGC